MEAALPADVVNRQLQPVFVAENALVLRAVILEHTPDVGNQTHDEQIQHENQHFGPALDQIAPPADVAREMLDQPDDLDGQIHKQQQRQRHAQNDAQRRGDGHNRLAEMLIQPLFKLRRLALFL